MKPKTRFSMLNMHLISGCYLLNPSCFINFNKPNTPLHVACQELEDLQLFWTSSKLLIINVPFNF